MQRFVAGPLAPLAAVLMPMTDAVAYLCAIHQDLCVFLLVAYGGD